MPTTSNEIMALYSKWMTAIRDKDMAELDRIVAPSFRYTDNVQGHKRRNVWIEAALTYEMTSFEFTGIEIEQYDQVVVVFVQYRQEAKLRGVSRSGDWFITDVWHHDADEWEVVARSAILRASS
jgi:ketosteroid isomerase-like protein